ncbi:hypothetical protein ACHAQA_004062 [Verticillium albo-atrum]
MADTPWMPPPDERHSNPYVPNRRLMITRHTPPDPFGGPMYQPESVDHQRSKPWDLAAAFNKSRSQLVLEYLPRNATWPTNDCTKSPYYSSLVIERQLETGFECGAQVVLCRLGNNKTGTFLPDRVVAKIYDPLYYDSTHHILVQPADVVSEVDRDLSQEAAVYEHLKAQGKDGDYAPRYYGCFTTPIYFPVQNKFRPVCLILLEYIEGKTMDAMCRRPHDVDPDNVPDLVPGAEAGDVEQRMRVFKKVLEVSTGHQHAGVCFSFFFETKQVMISRPLGSGPDKDPRVVVLSWKFAYVNEKTSRGERIICRLPRPITPIDWYKPSRLTRFRGWVPQEYYLRSDRGQKFKQWLEKTFGGDEAAKYCRKSDVDELDS